jgi:hypothetical protein
MSHTATISSVPIKDERALRKMAEELNRLGIKCELKRNAVPRMFYADQIKRHLKDKGAKLQFHTNTEECDFVLHVPGAYYDVGFLKSSETGSYIPLFDDYDYHSHQVPGTRTGRGPLRNYIGAKFDGKIEHWSGQKEDTDQTLCSIGKALQLYTKHATILAAEDSGYTVVSDTVNEKGEVVLEIETL